MAHRILMLDGDENIVSEFKDGLLNLGVVPIELDTMIETDRELQTVLNFDESNNSPIPFEDEAFFGKRDDSQYGVDPTVISFAVTLLTSASFASIVTSILNAHKGDGSIEIDEKGNITKVTFNNVNPKKVPKMITGISQAINDANKFNKDANNTSISENDFSTEKIED